MIPNVQTHQHININVLIFEHLNNLLSNIDDYFPSISIEKYDWIRNPFSEKSKNNYDLNMDEEIELSTLAFNRDLMLKFNNLLLDKFWIFAENEYSNIGRKAIIILLQISTSYL